MDVKMLAISEDIQLPMEVRKCFSCHQCINVQDYISWELIEFCNIDCIVRYHKSLRPFCSTCLGTIQDNDYGKYHIRHENSFVIFCSKTCSEKYAKAVIMCAYCEKSLSCQKTSIQLYLNKTPRDMIFCNEYCLKNFVRITKMCPPEIPHGSKCSVCKTDNPVTIVRKHDGNVQFLCSNRCQIASNFVKSQMGAIECKMCADYFTIVPSNTFIVYEENARIFFCSRICKNLHMVLKSELVICSWCQGRKSQFGMIRKYYRCLLENLFCCVYCFVKHQQKENLKLSSIPFQKVPLTTQNGNMISEFNQNWTNEDYSISKKMNICIMTTKDVECRNVATMCMVSKYDKSTESQIKYTNKCIQTDILSSKTLLAIPVPIFVPAPLFMYSILVPTVLPVPVPVPVPIFLPCSQDSLNKIINKYHDVKVIPKNTYEAEILKIAELIAEDENSIGASNEAANDKVALNASYLCESSIEEIGENIDVEYALSANTCEIMRNIDKDEPLKKISKYCDIEHQLHSEESLDNRGNEILKFPIPFKTDMRLDYSLGINAWKQWASKTLYLHKNMKFIKAEILEMTPEELCYALCLFVKELRKPNGEEYAPDTIYYLCLGIQYYLDISGRTDCIFFERLYEKFIDCFDEFAKKFCTLYDDESHFIVTRVEEEHLWETKQLGCWSPYALLNTLVYFNTKYYCRSNVEEHMELSFFHIMKAYKKAKADNYFILRLYPKSKANDKQVYEQYQNKDDPLRCPVKLYEFYLSKCPESVKNSPNMLYLMPEKYVISESPLWYSTTPLPKECLAELINRVKMIKEINVALLSR